MKAIVNLFDFSLGITICIDDASYKTNNCNADGIMRTIENHDIDEIVLVGPKVITSKYEKDLMSLNMTHFGNSNYTISCMEGI